MQIHHDFKKLSMNFISGNMPQNNKGHIRQTQRQYHTNSGKKSISSKIRKKKDVHTYPFYPTYQWLYSHSKHQEKGIKHIEIGKEE